MFFAWNVFCLTILTCLKWSLFVIKQFMYFIMMHNCKFILRTAKVYTWIRAFIISYSNTVLFFHSENIKMRNVPIFSSSLELQGCFPFFNGRGRRIKVTLCLVWTRIWYHHLRHWYGRITFSWVRLFTSFILVMKKVIVHWPGSVNQSCI